MSLSAYQIAQLLEKEQESFSVVQRRKQFYSNFEEAASFLLSLQYDNLFEPAHNGTEWLYRCKGCRRILARPNRREHFDRHKNEFTKLGD